MKQLATLLINHTRGIVNTEEKLKDDWYCKLYLPTEKEHEGVLQQLIRKE